MKFYHETHSWLYGGVFDVLHRHADCYEVRVSRKRAPALPQAGLALTRRLVIKLH